MTFLSVRSVPTLLSPLSSKGLLSVPQSTTATLLSVIPTQLLIWNKSQSPMLYAYAIYVRRKFSTIEFYHDINN